MHAFRRLAPLSQGRIEPSDGTLQCSYHGWRFSGNGKAAAIPQAAHDSPHVEETACSSKRSCAATYPTQVGIIARIPAFISNADGDRMLNQAASSVCLKAALSESEERPYFRLSSGWCGSGQSPPLKPGWRAQPSSQPCASSSGMWIQVCDIYLLNQL